MPTVTFITMGCKVNHTETESMAGLFRQRGYIIVEPVELADVYVINTCSVTHLGERKSRQMVRRAVRQNPEAIGSSHPLRLYEEGVKALEGQDRDTAMRKFTEAWKQQDQLDPEMRQQLKDKLTFLRANNQPTQPLPRPDAPAPPSATPTGRWRTACRSGRQRDARFLSAENWSASIASTLPTLQVARLVLTLVPVGHRRLAVPSLLTWMLEAVASEAQSPRKPIR